MLTTILAIGAALFSQAEDAKTRARALIDRGNQSFALGDYETALASFRAAYEAYPSPKILLNMAEAYRGLGQAVEAVRHYERFLDEAADPGELAHEVRQRIQGLDGEVGRIQVTGVDEEADVSIDGASPPSAGPMVVDPGTHQVTVTKAGTVDVVRSVEVSAGALETVEVELVPVAPPPVATTETEVGDDPVTERWWFWTGIGAAVVLVVGVSVGVAASSGGDDFVPMGELGRSNASEWTRF